jgi:ribA/ribD-fused uncharacterized protein
MYLGVARAEKRRRKHSSGITLGEQKKQRSIKEYIKTSDETEPVTVTSENSSESDSEQPINMDKMQSVLDKIAKDVSCLPQMQNDLQILKTGFQSLSKEVSDVKASLQFTQDETSDLNREKDSLKDRLNQLEMKLSAVELLKIENKALKHDLARLESYGRRENLIFRGIPETKDENCVHVILKLCVDQLGIVDAPVRIKIARCHRLGSRTDLNRSRPIICRLAYFPDRQEVWGARRNLKNSNIFIKEDFPEDIERKRQQLYPILKMARNNGLKDCYMTGDKLVIQGRTYTVSTLHRLPSDLSPRKTAEKENDKYIYFSGRNSPFSNFYRCSFMVDGREYCSSEQYYHYRLAVEANGIETANKILVADDPVDHYKLGKGVQIPDIKAWRLNCARDVMKIALTAKFEQNLQLKEALINTGDKTGRMQ